MAQLTLFCSQPKPRLNPKQSVHPSLDSWLEEVGKGGTDTWDSPGAMARAYNSDLRQLLTLTSMKSILYPDFFRPPALPAVLLTPAHHLKLELKLVNSQPLITAIGADITTLQSLWSCCTAQGGSCSQPAPIFLLCAGNINPHSAPGAAALSTLLGLGSGIDLCLERQGGFGSQLRMLLARMDREQTDFLPHGIAGRKQ